MENNCYSSLYLSRSESSYEEDWPFRVGSDNNSEYKTFGKNFPDLPISKLYAQNVLSFGNYVERHDWVECLSKSIPGKTYYYNLRSGCSTWNRPISRYIHIPRYLRRESSFSDVQCYLQSPSLVVSDDDDDCCSELAIKLREKNFRREWILEQLYYNPKKTKNEYRPRTMKKLSNYNGLNSFSDSSSSDSKCYNDKYSTSEDDCNKSVADNLSSIDKMLPINVTNVLECNLSEYTEFERCVDSISTKTKLRNNIYNSDEGDSDLSSLLNDRENDKRFVRLVPRLKKIKYKDMLMENIKKKKITRRKSIKKPQYGLNELKKEVTRKSEKIICDMYGITTVNYNDYDEEPQPNINGCNLSDSTSVVSSTMKENHSRSLILKNFRHDDLDKAIPPLMLSDSSSSNSSSSTSSFSSSSSSSSTSSTSSASSSSSSSTSFTCDTCSSTSITSTSSITS